MDGRKHSLFESWVSGSKTPVVLALVLAAAIALVYWPIVTFPFIQDDWGHLNGLVTLGPLKYLCDGVSQSDRLFWRPIGLIYFALYYRIFGLHPLPFHLVGMLIHFFNSLLVVFISWHLTRGGLVAWAAGFIYAVAVTVHMDPLLWQVGFYDLSASFLYLTSIALLLTKRRWLSAAAFAFGVLAKESTVTLVLVFPLILLYTDQHSTRSLRALLRKLGPWTSIVAVYCLVRMSGVIFAFSLAETEPYSIRLIGIHVLKNLFRYIWWSLEAVTPFRTLASNTVRWMLWGVTALVGALYFYRRKLPFPAVIPDRWTGFLAAWAVIGILPALFLPNHYYKYYLTYSLPPVVLLWISALYWFYSLLAGSVRTGTRGASTTTSVLLPPLSVSESEFSTTGSAGFQRNQLVLTALFSALSLINAVSAAEYFYARNRAGIADRYVVGTNYLIHRGNVARLLLDYLRDHHPSVPVGSVFLIDGCDLESIGDEAGPQAFYGDPSIRVFRLSDVREFRRGHAVKDGTNRSDDRLHLLNLRPESRNLFCLRIKEGKVMEEDPAKAVERE